MVKPVPLPSRRSTQPNYALNGLSDVEVDPVLPNLEESEQRITGRAVYQSKGTSSFQAIQLTLPTAVSFRLAPSSNPSAVMASHRLCKIYTFLAAPAPSPSSSSSSSFSSRLGCPRASVPLYPPLIGSWEAQDGFWNIFDDQQGQTKLTVAQVCSDLLSLPEGTEERRWADVLEVLIQVVRIIAGLHARSLSLVVCRPEFFVVHRTNSPNGPALRVALSNNGVAEIIRLSEFSSRSSAYSTPQTQTTATSVGSSSRERFGVTEALESDIPELAEVEIRESYEEITIRRHLRFLAPETMSTKHGSKAADIFTFGVFAFEILTGQQTKSSTASPTTGELLALIHQHLTAPVPSPLDHAPTMPPHLASIISMALSPDPSTRYHSTSSLLYDLLTIQSILYSPSPSSACLKFSHGAVDALSRFDAGKRVLVEREQELAALSQALENVRRTGQGGAMVWGLSGTGKSKLVETWTDQVREEKTREKEKDGFLLGWAKFDQHTKTPLTGFVQLFHSILDRIFSDPREDSNAWKATIIDTLSSQGTSLSTFAVLISPEWRNYLFGSEAELDARTEDSDWSTFTRGFRNVAQKVLQIFATTARPLVLVLDDVQWVEDQERELWQSLLDLGAPGRFRNVLVISIHRVDELAPAPEHRLSRSATPIQIHRFDERAVATFLSQIFHWKGEDLQANYLVAFLFDQTLGTPFFLKTLTYSLVRNGVVFFNFDTLCWTYNVLDLQDYASPGVDQFLARSLATASTDVKNALGILSCLPARGVPLPLLAGLLNKTQAVTKSLLLSSQSSSAIIVDGDLVRFAHDRIQQAASNLVEAKDAPRVHFEIAQHLRMAGSEYLFDAVDNFLRARSLGQQMEDIDELALFACQAAQRSLRAASFGAALTYLAAASELVDFDSLETWEAKRDLCMRFARTLAEACAIAGKGGEAISRIRLFVTFCRTKREKVDMSTLLVRLLISSGQMFEGLDEAIRAMKEAGCDPDHVPVDLVALLPKTAKDLVPLEEKAMGPPLENPTEAEDIALAVTLLAGLVGTQCWVLLPDHGVAITSMCFMLAARHPSAAQSPALPYVIGMFALALSRKTQLPFIEAILSTARRLLAKVPGTVFFAKALVTLTVQDHASKSLRHITFKPAWDTSMRNGDLDTASYVLGLECLTSLIGGRLFREDLSPAKETWFDLIDLFTPTGKILVNLARQTVEHLQATSLTLKPKERRFDGSFITRERDLPFIAGYNLHRSLWILCETWCGLIFIAPDTKEYLSELIEEGTRIEESMKGFSFFPEWQFIKALFYLTYGSEEDQGRLPVYIEELRAFTTPDWVSRVACIVTLMKIRTISNSEGKIHWSEALPQVEKAVQICEASDLPGLVGLLSFSTAMFLQTHTNNPRLISGYANCAYTSYVTARVPITAQLVFSTFPTLIRPPELNLPPTLNLHSRSPHPGPKKLESASSSSGTATSSGTKTTDDGSARNQNQNRLESKLNLESFLKTTLLIAAEKDPSVLIVKLMQVLLQFTRSDYGALCIVDPTSGVLHLRSAGVFAGLTAFDLPLSDCSQLAPISVLQHVGTTKKQITSVSKLQDLHRDSFFAGALPRSAMVLPLSNQGRFSGVVFLSSKHLDTSTKLSSHDVEVVASLGILACISVESSLSTKKLENIVSERTASLQSALNAKQTFLSHMSHELRTPLFAVLGLAAVLEDSPGLNSVQREHLATIRTSGEDLQTIISNLLDWSRLESGSLQAESIPFSLRDVIETTLESVATMAQTKNIEIFLENAVTSDPHNLLLGDPFRLKQILLNLLSNSVKFTQSLGSITVRWKIEKAGSSGDSRVTLSVVDTGVGIPPQKMDRLFKSFSQVDSSITRSFGGSGLGLAISQSLARLMGGSCSAQSEIGKGSTFEFNFIVKEPSTSPPEDRFASLVTPRNAFILCPPSLSRHVMAENLVAYRVFPIRSSPTVSDAISSANPEGLKNVSYDFIFVNPQLVSLDALRQMQSLQPKAKFLYMARVIDLAMVIDNLRVPHSAVITRPVKASSLQAAVQPTSETSSAASSTPISPSTGLDRSLAKACPMKILLVDDSKINIMVGRKILERFGYGSDSVDVAYDGQEAVEAAEAKRYSLIFMDLSMPNVDGYTANDRIKASPLAGTPIIIALTANADRDTKALCEEKGFFAHLVKPLNIPSLQRALRRAFEASQNVQAVFGSVSHPSNSGKGSPVYLEIFLMGC